MIVADGCLVLRAEAVDQQVLEDSRAQRRDRSRGGRRRRRPSASARPAKPSARCVAFSTCGQPLLELRDPRVRPAGDCGGGAVEPAGGERLGRGRQRAAARRSNAEDARRRLIVGEAPDRRARAEQDEDQRDQQPRAPAHADCGWRSFRVRLLAQPSRQGPAARRRSADRRSRRVPSRRPTASAAAALIAAMRSRRGRSPARRNAVPARGEWISATLPARCGQVGRVDRRRAIDRHAGDLLLAHRRARARSSPHR